MILVLTMHFCAYTVFFPLFAYFQTQMNVKKIAPVIHMLHVLTQKGLICACVMKDTLEMALIAQVKSNALVNLNSVYTYCRYEHVCTLEKFIINCNEYVQLFLISMQS